MPTIEPNVISGPIKEPITATVGKLYTRCDYLEEDVLYDIWIAAARDYVESHAGITMHEKTLEITLDEWPACNEIILPRATPLIAVTSVIYYDTAGTPTTWSAAEYIADTDSKPGRIALADGYSWPSTELRPINGIRIRYRAGIATSSPETEAPASMQYPVMLLMAGFDRNRLAETVPDRTNMAIVSLQFGVNAFIERLRVESVSY